jgi:hypothetical protein
MVLRVLMLVVFVSLVSGCTRLTQENYDKLKIGMGYDEVVSILGKPDSCSDTLVARSCIWGNEQRNITVNFIGNKIMLYASKSLK